MIGPGRELLQSAADIGYAVPVDPDRPSMLVATGRTGSHPPTQEIADLLSALSAPLRAATRLAPAGDADLLPVAQDVADLTGAEVEVLTAAPLYTRHDGEDAVCRPVLLGPGHTPTRRPFGESLICRPAAGPGALTSPPPLLGSWHLADASLQAVPRPAATTDRRPKHI